MKIKDTRSTFFAFVAALVMMLAASMVMGCKPNVSTGTQTFKLTFSAGDNGTLKAMVDNKEITSGSPVPKGKTVVFTAVPAAGYRVKQWTGTDNPASTDKTAVLTVKEKATVSVEFEAIGQLFNVTFDTPQNGTLKASLDGAPFTGGKVQEGKIIIFTAEPAPTYRVRNWTGTDNPASTDKTAVLTVKENATVSVEFESTAVPVQKFNVTFTQPKLGSLKAQLDGISFTGGEVEKGKVIVFTADIPGGCRIKQWNGIDTPAHTNSLATLTVSAPVTVSVDLEYNSIVDSSLLTINNGVLEKCDPAAEGVVEIPAGVTAIKDEAFKSCQYITGVLIPNSVTEIGKEAFYECERLTAISIPEGVTSIGKSAFYNCKRLTAVDIPNNVTTIGEVAFVYCSQLRSITLPKDLTVISRRMFYQCNDLETIQLPESITDIGAGAFDYCTNLEAITLPKRITEIKGDTFSNCRSLRTFNWGEAQVRTIGSSAFENCGLNDIVLPKTVTAINKRAFANSRIESIKITSENIEMGELIVYNCKRLKNFVILSQRCTFNFSSDDSHNRYYKLFSFEKLIQYGKPYGDPPRFNTRWALQGIVPSGLKVTVKLETVKNTLVSPGGIPATQITVDPALE